METRAGSRMGGFASMNISANNPPMALSRDTFERFLFAMLGFTLALSISGALIASALLLFWWFVDSLNPEKRRPWRLTSLDFLLLALYGWGVFSTMINHSENLRSTFSTYSAFLLYFMMAHRAEDAPVRALNRWFIIGCLVAGALGTIQSLTQINYRPDTQGLEFPSLFNHWPPELVKFLAVRNDRAMGTRSHPLTYAETFVPAFFLLLALVMRYLDKSPRERVKIIAALGVVTLGIVLAKGRGVWLGLFWGVVTMGIVQFRKRQLKFFLLSAFFGFSLLYLSVPDVRERVFSIFSSRGSLSDQQSKTVRMELWKKSLESVKACPLLGSGMGGVNLVVEDPVWKKPKSFSEAHNIYLQTVLENGIVGLLLFSAVLILLLKNTLLLPAPWKGAAMGTLIAFLIAGLTESWTRDKEVAMIFWTFAGIVSFLNQRNDAGTNGKIG